jgi:uncharacterized protein (TIGR02757 family)
MMRYTTPVRRQAALKERLDELVETFDIRTITPDPLELVLRYERPLDQEVAGLIAAAFAYGRADTVVRNGGWILDRMGSSPHQWLAESFSVETAPDAFEGFAHRFHKTPDLVALLSAMAAAVRHDGSLGALFARLHDRGQRDIGESLSRFVAALIAGADPRYANLPSLRYLLSSPREGSACKRMNLYLRWMVRRTSPDLGLWSFVDPSLLVMPLDTHIHRISNFLGLNDRRSADWKAARGLTDRLARFSPADPVRYDFALCRLGILDHCSRKRRAENCVVCPLRSVCRFPVTESSSS